ncbi:MAG TPA: lipid carrier--UDP-N-acetylgalactosaminyltransferase [Firmicutes bacterium]|nr:lipid carrier--UDP-N-acetylgalactosaminyltransferase [Bacillota bacterium]
MKRSFDIIGSIFLFILFLPIMFLISVCVFIDLGWPIIYKHRCPGLNETTFTFYRFNTMNHNKGSNGRLLPAKDRLTRFGKFLIKYGLDDLPQLWNVIKGDMSLVGPRPVMIRSIPSRDARQLKRHSVRPGLTGWAQLHDHRTLSWEEKYRLDMYYIAHQTLWLDAKIVWFTFLKFVQKILHIRD